MIFESATGLAEATKDEANADAKFLRPNIYSSCPARSNYVVLIMKQLLDY